MTAKSTLHLALIILTVLFLAGSGDSAAELTEDIAIHGFGGWAYGQTNNRNRYLIGNDDGSYDYVNFSLNITANPYDELSIYFQSSYTENFETSEVGLDYAFAEWFFSEYFSIRAGKIKAALMIYTEIYDVGTLRPFFTLPQGVYHDFAVEAYKGIGFTGIIYSGSRWEVYYDLYAGKIDFLPIRTVIIPYDVEGFPDIQGASFAKLSWSARDLTGGRINVKTPVEGLELGYSAFSGRVDFELEAYGTTFRKPGQDRYQFNGISFEYLSPRWWVRSEYLKNEEETNISFFTGYVEAAFFMTKHWQIAARHEFEYEEYNVDEDITSDYETFNRHLDTSLGLNYWFNQNFVIKSSLHFVEGNRFANPDKLEDFVDDLLDDDFEENTVLVIIGAQFSF
ncbi:hypothetical protein ACFL27_05810 [candidate division CSSED10-310 bacterium]|uniref:Porin n=1 Tax=candidate division CSSED10-310 bacterium TaxID=2855610 RepID=A0ABV6YU52_UNCC1